MDGIFTTARISVVKTLTTGNFHLNHVGNASRLSFIRVKTRNLHAHSTQTGAQTTWLCQCTTSSPPVSPLPPRSFQLQRSTPFSFSSHSDHENIQVSTTSMFVLLLLKLKKPLYFNNPTLLLSMETQCFPIAQSPPIFPTLNPFHCSNFNLF